MALWFHQDANFNVTSVSNDAAGGNGGVAVERYVYTPYGQRTVLHSDFTPVASEASLFAVDEGHQGLTTDAETGFVYNRHRYLHVTLGRFTSMAPHPDGPYVDGMNGYEYVRGGPVGAVDPRGTDSYPPHSGQRNFPSDVDRLHHENALDREARIRRREGEIATRIEDALMGLFPGDYSTRRGCCTEDTAREEAREIGQAVASMLSDYRRGRETDLPGGLIQNFLGRGCGQWQDAVVNAISSRPHRKCFKKITYIDTVGTNHNWIEMESTYGPGPAVVLDPWGSGEAGDVADPAAANKHRPTAERHE
jgi:RHS repeat-associated protein